MSLYPTRQTPKKGEKIESIQIYKKHTNLYNTELDVLEIQSYFSVYIYIYIARFIQN